jgi:hypothetical protein
LSFWLRQCSRLGHDLKFGKNCRKAFEQRGLDLVNRLDVSEDIVFSVVGMGPRQDEPLTAKTRSDAAPPRGA